MDNIFGFCAPEFAKVEKVFRRNFLDGWEYEGAALAVYHKGKLVVDLQGGYSDASSLTKWTDHTRTVIFSASKAVGALCIAMLVDRGHVRYEDKVSKFWPNFAQNGKENITLGCVMSHRAGLAVFDETVTIEDAKNPIRMREIIEKQNPNWIPWTYSGYHAITYGWLVDQIIRKVDPKKRGVGQFVQEEIAKKFDLDFFFGLSPDEEHTVSRLSQPTYGYILREILYDPRVIIVLAIIHLSRQTSLTKRILANPAWIKLDGNTNTFNSPELHQLEQTAALGITKARDLGKIFALMLKGELISKKLVEKFHEPQVNGIDYVVKAPIAKGHGFMYEPHPKKSGKWLFGHPGYGGSTIMMDAEEELVISYVSNGLKTGMGEVTRTYRVLRNAIFDSLSEIPPVIDKNGNVVAKNGHTC